MWSATRGEEVKLQLDGGEVRLVADAGGVAIRGNVQLANEIIKGSPPGASGPSKAR